MQWALISTVEQELSYFKFVDGNQQWITEMVPPGTVLNLIVYDGDSEYTPPEGSRLTEIDDSYQIGDFYGIE